MGLESDFMALALAEARAAAGRDEVPVGAVVTDAAGRVLVVAGNRCEELSDPLAHAEFLALRRLQQLRPGVSYFSDCTVWVTLEPCSFCAAAMVGLRVRRVVFAAYDSKGGAVEHGPRLFERVTSLWRPEVVGGVCEKEAGDLLRDFFQGKR
ncbi:MAG: nucleoside deaminase [Candidatus Pacebacteria bacterium]|nr:nucleoside deaminase [Candidatus Paceibacterota bacterium]